MLERWYRVPEMDVLQCLTRKVFAAKYWRGTSHPTSKVDIREDENSRVQAASGMTTKQAVLHWEICTD